MYQNTIANMGEKNNESHEENQLPLSIKGKIEKKELRVTDVNYKYLNPSYSNIPFYLHESLSSLFPLSLTTNFLSLLFSLSNIFSHHSLKI